VFDLGNVLILHDNAKLFRELAEACGRPAAEVEQVIVASDAGRRINVTDGPPSLVYDLIAPAIGFPGGFAAFAAIWNGIFVPNEPVFPIIESLRGRVPLFVLSNANPLHMAYIRPRLPVLACFEAVFTSYELGAVKPDAASYERALARAGVAPAEAAFFDDLPGHVEGATRVGMRGYLFTDVPGLLRDLRSLGLVP
jgi:FMN phosphatase YigB (HAD superfamily)